LSRSTSSSGIRAIFHPPLKNLSSAFFNFQLYVKITFYNISRQAIS